MKILFMVTLVMFAGFNTASFALDNEIDIKESALINQIYSNINFEMQTAKDPFKPVVQPLPPAPPRIRERQPVIVETVESKPVIQPLELSVRGIVGNEARRLAAIRYNNVDMLVEPQQEVLNMFKVVEIHQDRLVVYSNEEQRRRTFAIAN